MSGSVTNIGGFAFNNCSALKGIGIPDGVTSIGNSAFAASGLSSVTIPASVATIGTNAFSDCASLGGVYFLGNAPSVDTTAFSGDNNATIYYLPGTTGWSSPFAGYPALVLEAVDSDQRRQFRCAKQSVWV